MKKVDYKHHYDIFYPLLKSKQIPKNSSPKILKL